jgi:hypothetical protein
MNFIQEVLNLLERKQDKKTLDLKRDWFEFGRTRPSSVGNPLYTPKMNPHAIRYDDLKCNIISGLVQGTGTEHTLPMWSTVDPTNCGVQTMIDSIFSQDAGATEGKVSGDFRVTGNTVLEGNLLVLGTQTIVESTIVQVADNIMQINSGGGAFDAGIEVIQPSGTKTWAWDNAKGLWSTFGDSIITQDIVIEGAIKQDGEYLVNVVNEAEGLASNDNDESYATVAAIIDWTDQMELDVSADTGIPLDILLNSETLQIRGGSNITTNADGATKIRIDLNDDIVVNSVTSNILTLTGAPGNYAVDAIVNNINNAVTTGTTLPTVKAIISYVDQERDYISNVTLTGTDLIFTGVNNAFSGTIDLSSFLDDTNLARIINGTLSGTDLVLTRDDATTITIDLSSIGNTTPVMTSTITGTGKLWDDTVQVEDAVPVSAEALRTYGVQFNDASQLVVNVPWESGSVIVANPGGPTADLATISIDGVSYAIGASAPADGNDFVDSVTLTGSDLIFTGSGGAFNGTIDLSGLSGTTYTASNGIELVTPTEFGLKDVTRRNTTNAIAPNHTDSFTVIDDIKTNSKGQVTDVNLKTVTLPASGTGADGVITNVALSGTDLVFTGSNGGFNGSIDLSSLSTVETLTSLSINANTLTYTDENGADTDIDLSLYLDDTNLARLVSGTLDAGTGVATFTRDDATTFTLDLSSLLDTDTNTEYGITLSTYLSGATLNLLGTDGSQDFVRILPGSGIGMSLAGDELTISSTFVDANDIDYVRTVALNGTSLDFTGIGNAFAGSIDLSSLSGATYTAGTYLTLTGGAFNHDATNRSNTTSTASPAAGASFTVVDSVVTNTTGHITGVNTKTVTLPDAAASSAVACVGGLTLSSGGNLTATLSPIQSAGSKLGFISAAADRRHYNIVWTIEYATSGSTGIKQLITAVRVTPNGGSAGTPITWNDSAYMVSEYKHTRTYSYTIANIQQGDMIEILIAGSTDVYISKAHISATIVECEAFGSGEITIPPADDKGDDPKPKLYNYYSVLNCASDTSGVMAVPTSIPQPLVDGAQYRYTLDNASFINTPWDIEDIVRVQSLTVEQIADFTVTALTRVTCPLT